MIHGVFGKLGAGKGLCVMDIIATELMDGFRDVVTNVPVRMLPWVNGQGIPQLGLRAYLLEKLHPLPDHEIDEMLKRVLVIEDIEKGWDLFLWRRDEAGEWFKLAITKVDEKGRPERFDAEEIKRRRCMPTLVVTDEAWQFYPNNGGFSRSPILPFYARQQRKLRDEWFIVTQHPTDVDAVLWNIAQDFWVCRNHGMERMGIFRQPAMFRIIIYSTNPAKGNAIRQREVYRRLDKKLSQCYDTTAGVGIGGGFAGDSNQKSKGLHVAWLGVAVLMLVAVLMFVPRILGKGASAWIGSTMNVKDPKVWSGIPTNSSGMTTNRPVARARPGYSADTNAPVPVYMVGFGRVGNTWAVRLSDGRVIDSRDARVTSVGDDHIALDGLRYEYRATPTMPASQREQAASAGLSHTAPATAELGPRRADRIIAQGLQARPDGTLGPGLPRVLK